MGHGSWPGVTKAGNEGGWIQWNLYWGRHFPYSLLSSHQSDWVSARPSHIGSQQHPASVVQRSASKHEKAPQQTPRARAKDARHARPTEFDQRKGAKGAPRPIDRPIESERLRAPVRILRSKSKVAFIMLLLKGELR